MQSKKAFFKEAVKNIKTSGTVVPSSKYLVNKMLNCIDFENVATIVEFGPGNGKMTSAILDRLSNDSKLICFEINQNFYKHLCEIDDDRLIVCNSSCEHIREICRNNGINKVDAVVSSLPLTNLPNSLCKSVLDQSYAMLSEDGNFLQYQYALTYLRHLKVIFNEVDLEFEWRNIPPAFIYNCKKR